MNEYVRICPACGRENGTDVLRCSCGGLLAGADLQLRAAEPEEPVSKKNASGTDLVAKTTLTCPFEDCAQENPPDSTHCLYCNRPLAGARPGPEPILLQLPAALAERYRVVRAFPAGDAETDLLLLEPVPSGTPVIAKIYPSGAFPRTEVLERLQQVDERYRVRFIETGISDGHAFELMEYCPLGTLRNRMSRGPLQGEALQLVVRELAAALAAVHQAGLVHRSLKPGNVLIRDDAPLELVLTNFGTVSVPDATQRVTGDARTLLYAAPESLSGVIDSKTDFWALGMLLLELVLGQHPFAGLSAPVILRHLSTRPIDLSAVPEPPVRTLLRGLLLRDPAERWGSLEIFRWLAGDPTLAEPPEESENLFPVPYRLGTAVCSNPEHLAEALGRHWKDGVTDLDNGQLLTWFREVVKDHDTVRLILDMRHARALPADVQLLGLILHLAPGVIPWWRGERLALKTILDRAQQALQGDCEAEAWLDALAQHRVLEAYAQAGNAEMADIVGRWHQAGDVFAETWEKQTGILKSWKASRQPGEVVDDDAVIFGTREPKRPPLDTLHARLLALAYDSGWEARFRRHVEAELLPLRAHCPWLEALGDPARMTAAELLVLEALLPEARKETERQKGFRQAQAREDQQDAERLEMAAIGAIETLKLRAQDRHLGAARCDQLAGALKAYFDALAELRAASGQVRPEILEQAMQIEPAARHLQPLLDLLREKQAVTRGWLSVPVIVFFALAMAMLPSVVGHWLLYLMLGMAGAALLWRLVPEHFLRKSVRAALKRMVET